MESVEKLYSKNQISSKLQHLVSRGIAFYYTKKKKPALGTENFSKENVKENLLYNSNLIRFCHRNIYFFCTNLKAGPVRSGSIRVLQISRARLQGVAQDPLQFDIRVKIGIQSENQVQCLPVACSVTSFNGRDGFSSAEKNTKLI